MTTASPAPVAATLAEAASASVGFSKFNKTQITRIAVALGCPFGGPKDKSRAIQYAWTYAEVAGVNKYIVAQQADLLLSNKMTSAEWLAHLHQMTAELKAKEKAAADMPATEVFGTKKPTKKPTKKASGQTQTDKRGNPRAKKGELGVNIQDTISLMRRDGGATAEEVMAVTKWEKSTFSWKVTQTLKKRLGLKVEKVTREGGATAYIIPTE